MTLRKKIALSCREGNNHKRCSFVCHDCELEGSVSPSYSREGVFGHQFSSFILEFGGLVL